MAIDSYEHLMSELKIILNNILRKVSSREKLFCCFSRTFLLIKNFGSLVIGLNPGPITNWGYPIFVDNIF